MGCVVLEIKWAGNRVTIIAERNGQLVEFLCKTCIITVPLSILQQNTIKFTPELSEQKQNAIKSLSMQAATKLIFRFSGLKHSARFLSSDLAMFAHRGLTVRWWTAHYGITEKVSPVLSCYITSDRADLVDAMTEEEAKMMGLRDLASLFAIRQKDLEAELISFTRVSWAKDPFAST